jgi:hypothetical protein
MTANAENSEVSEEHRETLMQLYRDFNNRDIDAAIENLAPGVDWPNGMAGGREIGRDAVRAYWTKQWSEVDSRAEPLEITFDPDGNARVRVDLLVRSLDGKVLMNRQAEHVYEFSGPFIARMTIVDIPQPDDDEEDE